MTNLPVNYHNFEVQKENIKRFSEKIVNPVELKSVEETKWWDPLNYFDHKVTGKEFNCLIEDLQKELRKIS